MALPQPEQVTELLEAIHDGDTSAWSRLLPLVNGELRRIARAKIDGLARGASVCTTELVQDAYVRLLGRSRLELSSRKHFYAAVAQSMRNLLIDSVRRRDRLKRGGEWQRVQLGEDIAGKQDDPAMLLAIDDALHRLEREDKLQHDIVNLRYFGGLSIDAVAETLNVSPSTVDRNWRFARAWLHRELSRE